MATSSFEGRERDIVLLSSIGVLSSCLPNVFGNYDGKEIYSNLYTLFIAPPASGKGVMNYSRLLVERIHDKLFLDSRRKMKKYNDKNDTNSGACPKLEIKIVPANISSSEMYSYLGSSKDGIVIIESEADTMSAMMKNDWSNYSDVLRSAFHHEAVSICRKGDNLYLYIKEPKLSIVMSGTPNQFMPLMQSKGNGLFSRFMMYTFDETQDFKDVFAPKTKEYKTFFDKAGIKVFNLYSMLSELDCRIEFKFTENQRNRFLNEFKSIQSIVKEEYSQSFLSNLNRHGLMFYRMCMILTALRGIDAKKELICSNRDFIISLKIIKTVLKHALIMHDDIEDGVLSKTDEKFLYGLKKHFTRKEAVELGTKYNIPERTVDDKLVQWRKKRAINKTGHGKFTRVLS
ncbi:DUF3987 domain-containing protein [Flaviramulus aquimarinus]|uniref:DUF3987 domain-containing protein n=1 Tax=Flaviramulus aquimarinus TaxID=1170456 RepID=UPI0031EA23F9